MTERRTDASKPDSGEHFPDAGNSSFSRRLRERFGEGVDPALTLGELPGDQGSPDGQGTLADQGTQVENTLSSEGAVPSDSAASSSSRLQGLASRATPGERYRMDGEVARGGMGAILRVWDSDLRRPLAMKVVLGNESPAGERTVYPPRRLERFLEEAQITAQLDHPGIVPVHELGLDEAGRVYFTMKMVKGGDLRGVFEAHRSGDPRWSLTRCLSLVIKVCDALSYAHDKGVVHRDVKPANVMVGRYGEVYLMDWGLAKVQGRPERARPRSAEDPAGQTQVRTDRVDEVESGSSSAGFTLDGSAIGTPYYMPPEQASGQLERIGPPSDVYAVGAILYELFAGRPPYQVEGGRMEASTVLALVIHGPPHPLAEQARGIPPELVSICEKAMAREPLDRYSSIAELAEDLRNYIEGKVVKAHASGAIIEFRKWVQRNRSIAAGVAAALLLALGGAWRIAAVESERASLAVRAQESERERAQQLADLNATLASTNDTLGRTKDSLLERNEELQTAKSEAEDRNAELQRKNDQLEAARLAAANGRMLLRTERDLLEVTQAKAEAARAEAVEAARQAEEERDAADSVIDFVVDLFKDVDPYAVGEQAVTAKELLEQGIQNVSGDTGQDALLSARLLDTLGGALVNSSQWLRATPLLEEAHAIRLEHLGRLAPMRLHSANRLALAWSELGRTAEAEALYREVLAAREESQGVDHPDTLAALNNLATLLANSGRLREAGPMLESCYELRRDKLGERNQETLSSLNNLGMHHLLCGRFEPAEELLRRALDTRLEVLGPEDPGTLYSQYSLAEALRRLGRIGESVALLRVCLEAHRRHDGRDHPDTIQTLFRLATHLDVSGAVEEAETLISEDQAEREGRLGELHPEATRFLRRLASWHSSATPERAEPILRECLRRQEEAFGAVHPSTLDTLNALGVCLIDQDRDEEAAPLLERCAEGRRSILGEDHPFTLATETLLIRLAHRRGEVEQAEKQYLGLIERMRSVYGPTHDQTLAVCRLLARLVQSEGRLEEAVQQFEQILEMERLRAERSTDTLAALRELARCDRAAGRHEEALALFEEELAGWRVLRGDEASEAVSAMQELAEYLLERGRPDDALFLIEECILATPDGPELEGRLVLAEKIRAALDEAEAAREEEAGEGDGAR